MTTKILIVEVPEGKYIEFVAVNNHNDTTNRAILWPELAAFRILDPAQAVPITGVDQILCVVESLRDCGYFRDETGDATETLESIYNALLAAPSPAAVGDTPYIGVEKAGEIMDALKNGAQPAPAPAGVPGVALLSDETILNIAKSRPDMWPLNAEAMLHFARLVLVEANNSRSPAPDEYEEVGEQYLVRDPQSGEEFWYDKPYYNYNRHIATRKTYAKREKGEGHDD